MCRVSPHAYPTGDEIITQYFKLEGEQKEDVKAPAFKPAIPAASNTGGKFRPLGMISPFCVSIQLPHHLHTSTGADVEHLPRFDAEHQM